MKFLKRYYFLLVLPLALLAGCDEELPVDPAGEYSFSFTDIESRSSTAVIQASYTVKLSPDPTVEVGIVYAEENGSGFYETPATDAAAHGTFTTILTGLAPNTKYLVYCYARTNENKRFLSQRQATFTTTDEPKEDSYAIVGNAAASQVAKNTAVLTGTYTLVGSQPVSEAGFNYRKNGGAEWISVTASGTSSPFTYTVSGLTAETQYEVTAWVKAGDSTYESASATSFTTPEEESTVVPAGGWAELPLMPAMDNVVYVTHYVTSNGQSNAGPTTAGRVRNYTLCYDTERLQPLWAAYPMHPWYNGGVGRNDSWNYDPYISTSLQPNLGSSYVSGYSRGHQVASSDRQKTVAMNKQTFYYSNMSPQVQNEFNGGIWNDLEKKIQSIGFNCSDTLYVVTGSAFIGTTKTASDKSGNTLPVPTHFFKVLLSSKTGKTGKPISQLSASELKCVGFWFGHFDYGTKDKVSSAQMKSVAEIESLTGFSFFPMLPENAKTIKNSYTPGDWGM